MARKFDKARAFSKCGPLLVEPDEDGVHWWVVNPGNYPRTPITGDE